MDVWHLAVFVILEQATGNFGSHRFNAHFHRDRRHHSVRTEGWDPAAGFPAMAGIVPFLMKDVVLLAVSFYLLKQDVARMIEADPNARVELSEAR
jgi:hypothetical protein